LDLGTGTLFNLSDGGEGVEFNEMVRAKLSAATKKAMARAKALVVKTRHSVPHGDDRVRLFSDLQID
jgi:hypothetical protein